MSFPRPSKSEEGPPEAERFLQRPHGAAGDPRGASASSRRFVESIRPRSLRPKRCFALGGQEIRAMWKGPHGICFFKMGIEHLVLVEGTLPLINMEPDVWGGGSGLDRFPFKEAPERPSGSMSIGVRVSLRFCRFSGELTWW